MTSSDKRHGEHKETVVTASATGMTETDTNPRTQQPTVTGESNKAKASGVTRARRTQALTGEKVCSTPACGKALTKAKSIYCSEVCYIHGCREIGVVPRTCNQPGCVNVSVPGEQGGAKCGKCYAAHKLGCRQAAGQLGRTCGLEGCGNIVYGEKPKYGQFCSLQCGRASGQGRACAECGTMEVFKGSQSGKLCLDCYNVAQNAHKRPKDCAGAGCEEGRGGKRRKAAVP